eukprot:SAG11_NODE_415_length_9675_cov_2.425961_6_plen_110_part_00
MNMDERDSNAGAKSVLICDILLWLAPSRSRTPLSAPAYGSPTVSPLRSILVHHQTLLRPTAQCSGHSANPNISSGMSLGTVVITSNCSYASAPRSSRTKYGFRMALSFS